MYIYIYIYIYICVCVYIQVDILRLHVSCTPTWETEILKTPAFRLFYIKKRTKTPALNSFIVKKLTKHARLLFLMNQVTHEKHAVFCRSFSSLLNPQPSSAAKCHQVTRPTEGKRE